MLHEQTMCEREKRERAERRWEKPSFWRWLDQVFYESASTKLCGGTGESFGRWPLTVTNAVEQVSMVTSGSRSGRAESSRMCRPLSDGSWIEGI